MDGACRPVSIALLLGGLDRRLAGAGAAAFGDEGGQRRHRAAASSAASGWSAKRRRNARRTACRAAWCRSRADRRGPASAKGRRKPSRPADPVLLHQPDLVRPALEPVEAGQQLLGISGDLEEPLGQLAPLHRRAGAPAAAVDHLLVGQHGVLDRVPVDPGFLAIGQPGLEEVEEHLLLVPVIVGIAGRDLARPVVGQSPMRLQLRAHGGDILVGPRRRMDAALDAPRSPPAGRTRPSPSDAAR